MRKKTTTCRSFVCVSMLCVCIFFVCVSNARKKNITIMATLWLVGRRRRAFVVDATDAKTLMDHFV